jgi:ribose transport system permease protein
MRQKQSMATQTLRGDSIRERALQLFAKGGVLAYLIVLVLAFGIANSQFLSASTLFAIVSVSCPLMVVSAAMTMCLICAEVDLSVVGVVGLSSTLTALLLIKNFPWPVAVVVAVIAGGVLGAINGLLTGHLVPVMPFFPSFFPTLATTALALGLAEAMLPSKQAIAISDPGFATTFGFAGTLNVPIVYALAVVALMHLVLTRTSFGYRIQAVGANRKASPLVGTNVRRTKFWVLTVSGLLAGFGGVLTAGFFQAGYSQLGKGYDLDAIGAAVIGGTALFGGKGNVIATVWGVLVLAVLNTGLQMIQVEPAIQLAAKGTLVVTAVAVDLYVRRRLAVS